MNIMDWQTVAHLSRLTILNRVAFTMLFFVPLLSGFLKPVRYSVDKANAAIDTAEVQTANARDVAQGARALAEITSNLRDGKDEPEPVVQFASTASGGTPSPTGIDRWFEWNINTPFLPRPWALAFVAALLILIADTIFQIWCPARIKQGSVDDYVRQQGHEFSTQPSRSLLEHARTLAKKSAADLVELEAELTSEIKNADEGTRPLLIEDLKQVRTNMVELSSRSDYAQSTTHNGTAAAISFLLYLAAASFVMKILQEQTFNVLRSAGWWEV